MLALDDDEGPSISHSATTSSITSDSFPLPEDIKVRRQRPRSPAAAFASPIESRIANLASRSAAARTTGASYRKEGFLAPIRTNPLLLQSPPSKSDIGPRYWCTLDYPSLYYATDPAVRSCSCSCSCSGLVGMLTLICVCVVSASGIHLAHRGHSSVWLSLDGSLLQAPERPLHSVPTTQDARQ